ncbi:hypothetical protein [Actinomadura sediminis]|uniref:Uncharacterized protein n=1 Tax=Actinomadura sediminis TaxID=1038904 RepID=A0ABW3F081_9ACTN
MSTRNLGLLTTTAVAALALGGFAGTALAAAPNPPGADTVPASDTVPAAGTVPPVAEASPKPAAKPAKPAAKDGTDLEACADGACEVVLEDGQEIKLDDRFGIDPIGVEIKGTRVTFTLKNTDSTMITSVDARNPDASVHWNDLTLRPRMTEDGKLVVNVSHRDAGQEKPADKKPAGKKPSGKA